MVESLNLTFPDSIEWEGPEGLNLIDWFTNQEFQEHGLKSLFLVKRSSSLAATIGVLAGLDQFTPVENKTLPYYSLVGTILLASIRPFDVLYVPKKFDKLVSTIVEDPKQLRRTVKESDLYGVLPNRETLKSAIKFLCDKKMLEPIGGNEYLIARRPIKGIGLRSVAPS
jgi:hypothetical protein